MLSMELRDRKRADKRRVGKTRIFWVGLTCFVTAALGWTSYYVSQVGAVVPALANGTASTGLSGLWSHSTFSIHPGAGLVD